MTGPADPSFCVTKRRGRVGFVRSSKGPWGSLSFSRGVLLLGLVACTRSPAKGDPVQAASGLEAGPAGTGATTVAASSSSATTTPTPAGAKSCRPINGPDCLRFATTEEGFQWILAKNPHILAIGEAHAQKGTENIASSTKRFTETLLPIVAPRASDVVVELWAPDPKCMREVKQVASAQKPVTDVQASTNQNEYVVLGTKAKEAGLTPWLLRPTCDDFSMLADAGADTVQASLGLIKRLTQTKVTQLYEKNKATNANAQPKIVLAYGGALHNDLAPSEAMKDFSFGPDLDRLSGKQYIELDLIVPEFVKRSPTWEKLPWFSAFESDKASGSLKTGATIYVTGPRSFVLIFPSTI